MHVWVIGRYAGVVRAWRDCDASKEAEFAVIGSVCLDQLKATEGARALRKWRPHGLKVQVLVTSAGWNVECAFH